MNWAMSKSRCTFYPALTVGDNYTMFTITDSDIELFVSNIETQTSVEECTFATVCQTRETMHLQFTNEVCVDQQKFFYAHYPMWTCISPEL